MNLNLDFFDFNNIIAFLTSPEVQTELFPVKIAFLVVGGGFIAIIIFILLRSQYLKWLFLEDLVGFFTYRPYGAKRITRTWRKTLRKLEIGTESDYKLAVIEADDMLESSLKRMGHAGQNLEECLSKLTPATLPNIDQIYEAHQTRNNIVRNPDFRLSLNEARKLLEVYEQAFRDLQILE